MTDAPKCEPFTAGGCEKPAAQVILARAGENMVGNGMAVWTAYWRCGEDHHAQNDANAIKRADPDAMVLVFSSQGGELVPGVYSAVLAQTLPTA
jgi:hypothetical protein